MFTTRPELAGTFGMVSSTHWLASAAGMAVLESGGNAVDAAVAAGFTLQVVEPHLNGPGGEVPILFAAPGAAPRVVCGQGPTPAAATPEAFAGMDCVPGSGVLAACVPGAFDAWCLLLRDHGTRSLADVLRFAIEYAAGGIPVLPQICDTVNEVADLFRTEWPTSAALWLADGGPRTGSLFRNPALAATYSRLLAEAERGGGSREAIIDRARRAWSEGFVAEAIAAFCAVPSWNSSGDRHPGLLTAADVAGWSATYEAPVTGAYGDLTVCKTGPWGQGPVFLAQLRLLEELGIGDVDVLGPEFVHLSVEAAKLAFADREAWFGDPEVTDVPLDALLSAGYARQRATLVTAGASAELRPGSPDGRTPYLPAFPFGTAGKDAASGGLGEPTVSRTGQTRGDTCYLAVVDRAGAMVSATPSGGWLQSSPTIPELGFALSTRAQMLWLDGRSASALGPGRRPRTTLSPTLALRDDEPVLAFGTPGGDQQDQWSLAFFLRLMHGGLNLQAAIDAPAFQTLAFPSSFAPREMVPREVVLESRFGQRTEAELSRRGHRVTVADPWSLGRLAAVSREPSSGVLRAAANARGMQGYAAGR